MLDFEICKKLKEAGFDAGGEGEMIEDPKGRNCSYPDCHHYSPTLAELIAACGEKLYQITNHGEFIIAEDNNYHSGQGSTFEEAVANLWLSLNKLK